MEYKKLKVFASSIPASIHPQLGSLLRRLDEHGEVQFTLKDGSAFSIHQGDDGIVDDTTLIFVDREGQVWVISADAITNSWTHLGSKEN